MGTVAEVCTEEGSSVEKGSYVFEGCAEVWGFTWEERRNTLVINHLISTNWSASSPALY